MLTTPMVATGSEAIGSMGNDAALAVLSGENQLLFNYFKQLFAQVTNPPLDAIREELVTSKATFIGSEQNLFDETPLHCRQLSIHSPILDDQELEQIRRLDRPGIKSVTLSMLFDPHKEKGGLEAGLDTLCQEASSAIEEGCNILILSDKGVDANHVPIPSLLATSAVHHHLIRKGTLSLIHI